MKLPQGEEDLTEFLKETFRVDYYDYEHSRIEAAEIWNFYHNRQWTLEEQAVLENRGQPKETFNVIKLFARMLVGYYSTVVNTAVARPRQENDITMATMGSDVIKAIMESNYFDTEGDKLKLSAMVAGIMVCEVVPIFTGQRDRFGRPIYTIRVQHVPDHEVVLDSMSTADDYSDGRRLHRFKWVPGEEIEKRFGKEARAKLDENYNHLEITEADFYYSHPDAAFTDRYRVFDNYLLVHTVIIDANERRWSVYWCGTQELDKKEITHKKVKWNYRVVRTHTSNITEYYGIFREVLESQKAINQALVKLQLMANSQKIFIEHSAKGASKNAVDDLDEFTAAVNRVTGVIPVARLGGVKVEDLTREAMKLYEVIDKALDRIQRILSVNDSFLGMAYASDSGRKVKLQQNATIMALRYLTARIELMYRLLGEDILGLSDQYMMAEQALRVTDETTGDRFVTLNQPMEMFSGQMDPESGQPIMQPVFEQIFDPENDKPLEDGEGNLVFAPIPEDGTELDFDRLDVTIESSAYNDEDERAQLLVETVMNGAAGQLLGQINPGGYMRIASLLTKTMKTRYSPEIAKVFEETANMLKEDPGGEMAAAEQMQGVAGQLMQQSGGSQLAVPQGV